MDSDISNIFKELFQNFGNFGNDLTRGLNKVGDIFKQFSNLTEEENIILLDIYKKLSKEDLETIKNCLIVSDKEKIREILSKHCSNEKLINSIILSSDLTKEGLELEKTLVNDLENIINLLKLPSSDSNDNKKNEKTDNEEIDKVGTTIKNVLQKNGCLDVDMSQVKDILDQVMTKLETNEDMKGLRECTQKIVDNLENKLSDSNFNSEPNNVISSLEKITKKLISTETEPKIREGLVIETAKMIQNHKKLSDDINVISKTLTSSEIKMLENQCGGELPLDFRLRMMENTIEKLDNKLVNSEERDDLSELKEKIDDIALNIDILLTRLIKSKLI